MVDLEVLASYSGFKLFFFVSAFQSNPRCIVTKYSLFERYSIKNLFSWLEKWWSFCENHSQRRENEGNYLICCCLRKSDPPVACWKERDLGVLFHKLQEIKEHIMWLSSGRKFCWWPSIKIKLTNLNYNLSVISLLIWCQLASNYFHKLLVTLCEVTSVVNISGFT